MFCLELIFAFVLLFFVEASPVDRIVGGNPASILAYPYQVSLRTTSNSHFCGGSIISNKWILTASHCLVGNTPSDVVIVVGTNNLNSGGIPYGAAEFISHASYNEGTNVNDIALIRVSGFISFSTNVQPIQLSSSYPAQGSNLTLTGWGLKSYPSGEVPNILQYVNLIAIDVNQCKSMLSGFPVTSTHICTIQNKGKGACQGDSGGPLVYNNLQVGIVSWGIPCAVGLPDIFTSVPSYLNWVIVNTRQ